MVHMLTSESILSFHRVDPGAQVIIYVYLFILCGHVCSMVHMLTSESILSFHCVDPGAQVDIPGSLALLLALSVVTYV